MRAFLMPRKVFAYLLVLAILCPLPMLASEHNYGRFRNTLGKPVDFIDASHLLDFVHQTDGGGGLAGAAWFDYNNDSYLDLFLTNGIGHANGLFKNNGDGTFTDVSVEAGIENGLGNSGVIAGDIDNDGWVDLFLTGEGDAISTAAQSPTRLYYNNGDGSFTDITEQASVPGAETAWSAAFGDIDNDGYLDLFVTAPGSIARQEPHRNKLYRNNGDLSFTDISTSAGVDTDLGACIATFSDYDNDGDVDFFIGDCNDIMFRPSPVELWRNNGDLTFTDVTIEAGLLRPGAWMGFAVADYDNDGDQDIFATNVGPFRDDTPPILYENNGDGTFRDATFDAGIAELLWGWGSNFADFNSDGYADLFYTGSFPFPPFNFIGEFGNAGTLLINNADKTFTKHNDWLNIDMSEQFTSGSAVADFDNNGFLDIVVATTTLNGFPGRPILLQNAGNHNHWLTIRTVGTWSNRDGIGAKVTIEAGRLVQVKETRAGSSFLSMDSPWLTFGLGRYKRVHRIEVQWPSGLTERFRGTAANRILTLVEGTGRPKHHSSLPRLDKRETLPRHRNHRPVRDHVEDVEDTEHE